LRSAVSTFLQPGQPYAQFHEAMSRQARRARHSRQVFGLAGAHRVVLLLAVASRSRFV
jgi:hypothetical protein